MKKTNLLVGLLVLAFNLAANPILLETESFENRGGWFVDPQLFDVIGSSYLLAHGNGIPVANATTGFEIKKDGTYHVYVRTRNWVANWFKDNKYAPGIFKIAVNGTELPRTLGNEGLKWHWQYAGKVMLTKGNQQLALVDKTGFGGRCDAIYLTQNQKDKFLTSDEQLTAMRNELHPVQKGARYDFVVVGGGIAGICAAVNAARNGLNVCLINNRDVLGGNNSVEIKVVVSGKFCMAPFSKLGRIVEEIGNIYLNPEKVEKMVRSTPNLTLMTNSHAVDVTMKGTAINSVLVKHVITNTTTEIFAEYFADCTGDATIAYKAGAEYMIGRETREKFNETLAPEIADNLTFGSTMKWFGCKSSQEETFPVLPWAIQFTELTRRKTNRFEWFWETGFYKDQVKDAEEIRDYMYRVVYGNWSYLKNSGETAEEYKKMKLCDVSPIVGRREYRRVIGDVIFTQNDIEGGWKKYDDAFVGGTYPMDQHFPMAENSIYFPKNEFFSEFKHDKYPIGYDLEYKYMDKKNPPYFIPYRCLYSKNISNLFVAGRNSSSSRIAFTSTRIQATTGMMGELVGNAVKICIDNKCTPRDVYQQHLNTLRESISD